MERRSVAAVRPAVYLKSWEGPGGREPGQVDPVHDRGRRTFAEADREALDSIARPLRDALDRSIRQVGDPPDETQGKRLGEHEIAKADPMDSSGHGGFQPNDRNLV